MNKLLTVCPYCGCGCGLYLMVEGSQVVGTVPSRLHPIGGGKLCLRGWHAHEFVNHPDRLTTPLIREDGRLVPCSWERALAVLAKELRPGETGVLGSGRATNEEGYLLSKLTRLGLQTNQIDCLPRGAYPGHLPAMGALTDLPAASALLVVGCDPAEESPKVAGLAMEALDRGAKLVTLWPRAGQLSKLAALNLQPRPGSEATLLAGVARSVTEGGSVRPELAGACGVAPEALSRLAEICQTADPLAIMIGAGVWEHPQAFTLITALVAIAVRRPGQAQLYPLSRQCNLQGACDMGVTPTYLPGYRPVDDDQARSELEKIWGRPVPAAPGTPTWDIPGQVKRLLAVGADPAQASPDPARTRAELEALDFLAVQDIFLTETALMADLVLPAACFSEKDGTFTTTDRRVQRVRRVADPPAQARPDWEILCQIAQALGLDFSYAGPAQVMAEIAEVVPTYRGIDYRHLDDAWGVRVSRNGDHLGSLELHPQPPVSPGEEYPWVLGVDTCQGAWDGSSLIRHSESLLRELAIPTLDRPAGWVEMNSQQAKEMQLRPGRRVKVISAQGQVELPAYPSDQVAAGTAFIPWGARKQAGRVLGPPRGQPPAYQPCPVRLEPC